MQRTATLLLAAAASSSLMRLLNNQKQVIDESTSPIVAMAKQDLKNLASHLDQASWAPLNDPLFMLIQSDFQRQRGS